MNLNETATETFRGVPLAIQGDRDLESAPISQNKFDGLDPKTS
jgi:hypothetical protein